MPGFIGCAASTTPHRRDVEEAERPPIEGDAQGAEGVPLSRATLIWDDDPPAALASLSASAAENPSLIASPSMAAMGLARMAPRLRDEQMLERGIDIWREHHVGLAAPVNVARGRWMEGLAASEHEAVENAAAVLEQTGHRPHAADAWADAAILCDRTDVPSDAGRRAVELCTEMGMHPLLGPLPATRWLRSEETGASVRGA